MNEMENGKAKWNKNTKHYKDHTHACKHATLKEKMEIKKKLKNSFPLMKKTLPDSSMDFTYQQKSYALVPSYTPSSFFFTISFPSLKALICR
jgi:hypothetical protein